MKSICIIDEEENKRWYNEQGQLHREGGPAIEWFYGSKSWYINGKLHREDGAAVEYSNGNKFWWYQGKHIKVSSQKEFEKLIKLKMFW